MPNTGIKTEENGSSAASTRARNGAVPDWVAPCPYDAGFKPPGSAPITFLLFDQQVHAERGQLFIHQVIRLETMEAVQHWSQWRLQFEPQRQTITLHSLTLRRGTAEIDQSSLEKARFLQREEGLERFLIHGWFTLLMVLDDVRPGDVLDIAYTIETTSALFPDHGGTFFTLPQNVPVGQYHFGVQFAPPRPRRWKASAAESVPVERQAAGLTFWDWNGANFLSPPPEPNTPSWHVGYFWIQVSDFPGWQIVAAGLADLWVADPADPTLAEFAQTIAQQETSLTGRIERALRLVQDECRYLSVNLELGGQVPAPPHEVLRRRYGDCKDLSFLLVNLLNKLGVTARPILVNTFLQCAVRDFLPLPSLFNHAIVEFELDGNRIWVDTTFKEQGGGPCQRFIPDYDCGLPVTPGAADLVDAPHPILSSLFDLHEHVLLDTHRGLSQIAVTLHAEGNQADQLRYQLKKQGLDEWTKARLKIMTDRYPNSQRIGSIKYHDDRNANIFVLSEAFEVEIKLGKHANPQFCVFHLPGQWLGTLLARPAQTERRQPFTLPYPCTINYTVDVDNAGLKTVRLDQADVDVTSEYVTGSRSDRAGLGHFTMRLTLQTKTDFVPAEQIPAHLAFLEKWFAASNRLLNLEREHERPPTPAGFGELPADLKSKPPFMPASRLPAEPISPIVRHVSFSDKIRDEWTLFTRRFRISRQLKWCLFVLTFWILVALSKGCSDDAPKIRNLPGAPLYTAPTTQPGDTPPQ